MLAIYGAGSLGKEILSLLKISSNCKHDKICFIDDVCQNEHVMGIPKYTYNDFIEKISPNNNVEIVVASGEPKYRAIMSAKIKQAGYKLGNVISDKAYIGERTHISEGNIIFPNTYIGTDTYIGSNCIVHANSKIESGCHINENVFVSLGAFVGANTIIEKNVFIGPNSSLTDHIIIGAHSIVGIGSVVVQNVGSGIVVVGNPARFLRENTSGRVFKKENCLVADE